MSPRSATELRAPRLGHALGWLAALAILLAPRLGRADLAGDVAVVLDAWRAAGAHAERVTTVFLVQGQVRRVPLPPEVTAGGCLHLVALAERQIGFAVTGPGLAPPEPAPGSEGTGERGARGLEATAGVVEVLALCGPARPAEISLHMTAARGTVEVLYATSPAPLEPVDAILLERAEGPVAPRSAIGRAPRPGPLAARLGRLRRAAALDGVRQLVELRVPAATDGSGAVRLKLTPGCHRLWVLADALVEAPEGSADVDADVRRSAAGSEPFAADRSHAPDARLELCLGDADAVDLRFVGAYGAREVVLLDAVWSLPVGLPSGWSSELRGRVAGALFRRRMPAPDAPPLEEVQGGAGATLLPLELEPGRCYLATLGLLHGEMRGLRFAVRIGGRAYVDELDDATPAGALTYCSGTARRAKLEVELRSPASAWRVAFWSLGGDAR
ncbi:MAG: hypothetical protein IT373_25530 [Polyangiaceae bacterium]|nr:hypothetical protein [Polyangiaceae bacterium]